MGEPAAELAELVSDELFRPPPPAARTLTEAIRARFGPHTAAVVFYGSCLRKQTAEGVLDFYVIVDAYRQAYGSRALAWANAALPPNVFYVEFASPQGTLRAKYAVMTARDFERAAGPDVLRPGVWARFCQPALATWVRDDAARALLVRTAARAIRTALETILPLLPAEDGVRRFRGGELWQRIFLETYAYEMRPEPPEAAAALVEADRERFERAARWGLAALAGESGVEVSRDGERYRTVLPAGASRRAAGAWRRRRPLAKLVYAVGLLKSAATFGDWLPYALWKLERHTGTRIEPTERQRRHPFIWGWPLFLRVLRRRELR